MHRPRKRFGQHFLHDSAVIDRIVSAIRPAANDTMVEIGPGPGILTDQLAPRVKQLTVIEIDRDLAGRLEKRFARNSAVQVVTADALNWLPDDPGQPLRVVGNLPYNISTPLLFHFDNFRQQIADAYFMLQKEVVLRMAAEPGSKTYGRLSVMLQYGWEIERLFDVGPDAFDPPPKVDSSVVALRPRAPELETTDHAWFALIVKTAFAQRRKTLRNALRDLIPDEAIKAADIDPTTRAERLSTPDFVKLSLQKRSEKA